MNQLGIPAASGLDPLEVGEVGKAFQEGIRLKESDTKEQINRVSGLVAPAIRWRETNENDPKRNQIKQGRGAFGLATVRGLIIDAAFPIGTVPIVFQNDATEEERNSNPEAHKRADEFLDRARFALWNQLTSVASRQRAFAYGNGFHAAVANLIDHAFVHGDVCVELRSDLQMEVFGPSEWYVVRDGQGRDLQVGTCRFVDPKTMPQERLDKAALPEGWTEKPVYERMVRLYSRYRWEPDGKWHLCEECNGKEIFARIDEEPRLFTVPYRIVPGRRHAESFFDPVVGILEELQHIAEVMRDLIAATGSTKLILDRNSGILPRHFEGPRNAIIPNGRVEGGVPQDAAFLATNKHQDINALFGIRNHLEQELDNYFGNPFQLIPNKERTTRLAVQESLTRLNSMVGGQMIPFLSTLTDRIVRAAVDIADQTNLWGRPDESIAPILDRFWSVRFEAGPHVIARGARVQTMLSWAQAVQAFGPVAQVFPRLEPTRLAVETARNMGLDLSAIEIPESEFRLRQQESANTQLQQQAALESAKALAKAAAPQLVQ